VNQQLNNYFSINITATQQPLVELPTEDFYCSKKFLSFPKNNRKLAILRGKKTPVIFFFFFFFELLSCSSPSANDKGGRKNGNFEKCKQMRRFLHVNIKL